MHIHVYSGYGAHVKVGKKAHVFINKKDKFVADGWEFGIKDVQARAVELQKQS